MHGVLGDHIEDTCVLVRGRAERAFAQRHVVEKVLGLARQ